MVKTFSLAAAGWLLGILFVAGAHAATVTHLRCEHRTEAMGIDTATPRLSWIITSDRRAELQTAYQVLVASTPEALAKDQGDLWDSGRVASDQSTLVEYAGKPLQSRMRCYWKVRVWDKAGAASAWSDAATWTMGLLTPDAWNAKWIGAVKAERPISTGGIGYHAAETAREDEVKWVQADLGKSVAIERVVLHAMRHGHPGKPINGFGFPVRFRVEASDDADFKTSRLITDQTGADYPNPGHAAVAFDAGGATARYVRVTATKLWNRRDGGRPYCFALAQLEVIAAGNNAAMNAAVTAKDSVENSEWSKVNLTDGQRFSAGPEVQVKGDVTNMKPSATIQLRKEFSLEKDITRAVVYVCGLGFYELHLNGQKVGDRVLDPGWTNYRKTCLYSTYDVTAQLTRGRNAIGVMLGNGMYNVPGGRYVKFTGSFGAPKVILQLYVEHPDGTSTAIASDESWTWAPSPVVFSCIYGGEDYDARQEMPGWDKPAYDGGAFKPVVVVNGPGGRLSAQAAPPIKVMKEYKPVKITQPRPGVWVYDFGQNCASMPRLTVKGPAGSAVRLTPGELLRNDGLVSQGSSGGPAYYTYTLKGAATETWTPRFFYYGSRYLQVETSGHDSGAAPRIVELTSQFVHSSAATVGSFVCANPLVNRVHDLINAAIKSNLQSVLTDCPHREKLGWLECSHLLAGCVMYNYDVPTFYAKIANDMSEAQLADGMVPDIAPEYTVFRGGFRDSPEWGSAYVITPWQVYQMYGDRSLLARHYEGMKRYVEYLKSTAKENIVSHGLGDWYDIGPGGPGASKLTSRGLTATAIYYRNLVILKETAKLLDKAQEASQFEEQAHAVKEAFNRKYFNADKNQYDRNSQTANAMPLVLGLVPEDRRPAVLDGLVAQIRAGGNRVTAGDVGFNYLMRALSDGGRGDVLYDMLIRDDGPGYAFQLKKGATSLTEAWDTNPGSSQNHCMLGHIEEWFYCGLGGISSDPAGPGFKKIIIKPQIVGDLGGANVAYASPYGQIVSNWTRDGNRLTMDVTIPANTTATVFLPALAADAVTESGKPAAEAEGIKFLRTENGSAIYTVGSGTYRFCVTLQATAGPAAGAAPSSEATPGAAEPAIRAELRSLSTGPFIKDWQSQVGATTRPAGTSRFLVDAPGDGQTVCTREIQHAIDQCAAAGGGIVEFKPGSYVTGSLFIKSNVNFHVAKDVTLLGAQDDAAWPLVRTRAGGIELDWPAAMLNVRDQQNVSITGEGTINARGKRWWDRFWAAEPVYAKKGLRWAVDYDIGRPHMMQIYQSRDVTVQGLTFIDSPFWTLHTVYSQHVTIEHCTVNNLVAGTRGPSTDGINIDSSAFVLVENCRVDCNDDCLSFKAGINADGQRVNLPVQYCMFRNCVSGQGHGGITLGSDMSGGIRHCEATGIRMIGTASGIRLKSAAVRGGLVEDVLIHDVHMENVYIAIEMSLNWFPQFSYPKLPDNGNAIPAHWRVIAEPVSPEKAIPTWRDITITDVKGAGSSIGINASGLPQRPMSGFRLERIDIAAKTAGGIRNAKDWTIKDVHITGKDGKPVVIKECTVVSIP